MKRWKFQDHCDESNECDEITKEIFFDPLTFFIAFLYINIFQNSKIGINFKKLLNFFGKK